MKKALALCALLATFSLSAQAAEVSAARVNANTGTLEVEISYAGGCGQKTFALQVGEQWSYSSPLRGTARVVESGFDSCEALLRKKLVYSLRDLGLGRPEFRAASLTIYGESTSVEVTLPYEM